MDNDIVLDENIITYDQALVENLLTFQVENSITLEEIKENQSILIDSIDTGFTLLYVSLFVILGYQIARDFLKGVFK